MKSARRGVRMAGHAAYGNMHRPGEENQSDAALSAAIDSPAWGFIRDYLLRAQELGFDPYDLDIISRAIAAGEKAYADQPPPPPVSLVGAINDHEPIVYYMQLGNLVKIGTTQNIVTRVSSLNPERVLAIEPGDRTKEFQRHREFAASRRHGEWFEVTDELRRHMRSLREQFEMASGRTLDEWLARPSSRRKPPISSVSILDYSPSGPETGTWSLSGGDSGSADPS